MSNPHIVHHLAAYLADELTAPERTGVARHLAGCPVCAARLAQLTATEAQLRAAYQPAPALAAPAAAWARLQAARSGPQRRPALSLPPRLAAGLLAALVLLALLVPGVSAQLGAAVQHWVRLVVPGTHTQVTLADFTAFTPLMPSYLPPGFDLTTTGVQRVGDHDVLQLVFEHDGEALVLVQGPAAAMPGGLTGLAVPLDAAPAVLADSLAGVDPSYLARFADGLPKRLAWRQGALGLELYGELPLDEMARIANGLAPAPR